MTWTMETGSSKPATCQINFIKSSPLILKNLYYHDFTRVRMAIINESTNNKCW